LCQSSLLGPAVSAQDCHRRASPCYWPVGGAGCTVCPCRVWTQMAIGPSWPGCSKKRSLGRSGRSSPPCLPASSLPIIHPPIVRTKSSSPTSANSSISCSHQYWRGGLPRRLSTPPTLLQDGSALDDLGNLVSTCGNAACDGLEPHRCQDVRKFGVYPNPPPLMGVHAREMSSHLHMEALEGVYPRGR
jgi:hypothetical protein